MRAVLLRGCARRCGAPAPSAAVIDALFSEVNPIPVKAALAKMGYGTDTLRLPLTPMEEGSRAVLLNALEAWGV